MRYLIPFIIICILAAIILYSLAEIGVFYVKKEPQVRSAKEEPGWLDSKEQIISDLTEENERLKSQLQSLEDDSSKAE